MSKNPVNPKVQAEKAVKDTLRATRKAHGAEENFRIVLVNPRREDTGPIPGNTSQSVK
ncbi:hypothetical protein [Pseudogemmobacter sp. W21_MBD1_M6]|uniref:hypothetical protein n=1 Tax=Pseudogemmobacter sp. W21_MBD1_M6 TaxID=3240271 RepID=UPI003F94F304